MNSEIGNLLTAGFVENTTSESREFKPPIYAKTKQIAACESS